MEDPIAKHDVDESNPGLSSNLPEKSQGSDDASTSNKGVEEHLQSENFNQKETESVQNFEQTKREENNSEENAPLDISTQGTSENNFANNNNGDIKDQGQIDLNNKLPSKDPSEDSQLTTPKENPEKGNAELEAINSEPINAVKTLKVEKIASMSDSDSQGEGPSASKEADTSKSNNEYETRSYKSGGESDRSEEKKDDIRKLALSKLSFADFNKVSSLGKGSYAEVSHVKKITTGESYAMKTIDQNFMKKVLF